MAKPIVASNVAGCTNIVKDGTKGVLCKVKDSEDLALKMKKIIGMPLSERQKMGASGREMVVSSFDERIVITKYLNVIGRLTAQN
jgi:glycosyltransferase involved in cell wall biosynthesis